MAYCSLKKGLSPNTQTPHRILGLDPGLRHCGWGMISMEGNHLKHLAHGVIHPPTNAPLGERLDHLFQALKQLIEIHQPQEAAVEKTFVNKNPQSTLSLGMARGVVLLAPASCGLSVSEYAANKIKKSVVGVGHADKNQIIAMVKMLLPSAQNLTQEDAADALAVAICHGHHKTFL